MDAQKDMNQKHDILYVLNFRYSGGQVKGPALERGLKSLGWRKVADMTSCYVMKKKSNEDINQTGLTQVLKAHVDRSKLGSEVSFGISKYIPPNERPDIYEGIDTLFD